MGKPSSPMSASALRVVTKVMLDALDAYQPPPDRPLLQNAIAQATNTLRNLVTQLNQVGVE